MDDRFSRISAVDGHLARLGDPEEHAGVGGMEGGMRVRFGFEDAPCVMVQVVRSIGMGPLWRPP